jgi:hypothetical protein
MVSTPLMRLWLQHIAGLAPALARFALLPVALITLLPAITTVTCFQRALLVVKRTTRPITWASGVEVAGIAAAMYLLSQVCNWVGAVAAVSAMVVGRLAAMAFLFPKTAGALRSAG